MRRIKVIIMKFGGTSVGSAANIKNLKTIVEQNKTKKPVIVVSAISGITDMLIKAAYEASKNHFSQYKNIVKRHKELLNELGLSENLVDEELENLNKCLNGIALLRELTKRTLDYIMSFGERMSCKIIAMYLNNNNVRAKAFNSWDIELITDSNFGCANVVQKSLDTVRANLQNIEEIPVVTGFLGKDKNGKITTLGRGGSDLTASLIGSALSAEEIQIWTDVSGLMTADPKVIEEAKTIDRISFEEAAELAFFGANILHPKTIEPAMKKHIPVKILNIHKPMCKGTTIFDYNDSKGEIKAIAFKRGIVVFNIISSRMLSSHGFLKKIFTIFDKYGISVDMLSTSEVSVSLTIDSYESEEQLQKIKRELEKFCEVNINKNMAIICVVGEGLKFSSGISGKIFQTIAEQNVNIEMISQGASKISIGFVVKNDVLEKCVKSLHKSFWR